MIKAEKHDLKVLIDDLEKAAAEITPQVAKVTGRAMNNIKKDVKRRWSGLAHLPHLPRSITYDVRKLAHSVTGEVGAEHERLQGRLAWTQEYGTPTSAPNPAFRPAADKEIPSWLAWSEKVAAEALGDQ